MIITLLTDFGLVDNFVGVVKAVILGINQKVKIVDISHGISPGNIFEAAFLLKSSYRYFPRGTIHLAVVDPGVGSGRKAIMIKTENYYFIGPDNGVLSLALEAEGRIVKEVYITNRRFFLEPVSSSFHGRDIFAPAAAYLSRGRNITEFGTQYESYRKIKFPQARVKDRKLHGEIVYIDRFGNLITNINKHDFRRFTGKREFRISLKHKAINKINTSYLATEKDKPLAMFGSFDNLEISVSLGNAKDYFQARIGQRVKVSLI